MHHGQWFVTFNKKKMRYNNNNNIYHVRRRGRTGGMFAMGCWRSNRARENFFRFLPPPTNPFATAALATARIISDVYFVIGVLYIFFLFLFFVSGWLTVTAGETIGGGHAATSRVYKYILFLSVCSTSEL